MGLIGMVVVMVVNLFLASPMMNWVKSVIGIIVFTGHTAFDVQRLVRTDEHGIMRNGRGSHQKGRHYRCPGPLHRFHQPLSDAAKLIQ